MDGDDVQQQSSAGAPHEYDFSDDFNISEVKDTGDRSEPTPIGKDGSLPKSISEAVDKSLSQITKPGIGTGPQTAAPGAVPRPLMQTPPVRQPGASINVLENQAMPEPKPEPKPDLKPAAPATPPAPRPDPFREPIGKLDTEWPFASSDTLARHRDREKQPYELPQKQASVPADLPTGNTVTPVQAPRASALPPIPPPTRPGLNPSNFIPRPFTPTTPPMPRPAIPPIAPATPTPSPAAAAPKPNGLKNIRTYESDVAEVLANRPVTRTSMAIAESKKRGEGEVLTSGNSSVVMPAAKRMDIPSRVAQPSDVSVEIGERSHVGWKLVIIILSLLLIGGGIVGGYYLYSQSPLAAIPASKTEAPKHTPALVPYDSQVVLSVDQANNVDILNRITAETAKAQASSTVKEIVLTETKNSATYRVTAPEAILLAGVPAPDIIVRTLAPEWMLGVYAAPGAKHAPFIVVHTNLFQNAFSGMLAWEPSMIRDLQPFLGIPYDKPTPKGTFRDQIVKNKDVRAFVSDNDQTIFEYSFIDNSTLVITTDNATLSEIITRLDSKAFVR